MPFYIRKSFGFGPIRFNFSKSGIGVSAGIKGARIGSGPRGTYVHAGRNGFYYRRQVNLGGDESRLRSQGRSQGERTRPEQSTRRATDPFEIQTAHVSKFVDSSSAELLSEINEHTKVWRVAPFVAVLFAFLSMFIPLAIGGVLSSLGTAASPILESIRVAIQLVTFVALLAGGGYFSYLVHRGDENRRRYPLLYELEEDAKKRHSSVTSWINALSKSKELWRVYSLQPNFDWKRNAGAAKFIKRTGCRVISGPPPHIVTNIQVLGLSLVGTDLYFFPDYIFVKQGRQYGAISYGRFYVEFGVATMIENDGVPSDSRIVDWTWQYVRRDGGPDRRFSNNRQLPIVEYGMLYLRSESGLQIRIEVSNVETARGFAATFGKVRSSSSNYTENKSARTKKTSESRPTNRTSPRVPEEVKFAYDLFGIDARASKKEIVSAYRRMARQYHPDQVSHLSDDFVEFANSRMTEVNHAYQTLKQFHSFR